MCPEFFKAEFAEHHAVARASEAALADKLSPDLLKPASPSIRAGGKIMLFGNGGSAGDAQHLATELTIRYKTDRAPIAAIALTTDTSTLTAAGNDLGFEQIFARQIAALGRPGDVVIAISTSGKSPNVIAALKQARAMKLVTAGFPAKAAAIWSALPIICWWCRPTPPRAFRKCTFCSVRCCAARSRSNSGW